MNQHLSIKNIKNPPKNGINTGFKKISSISINTKKYYFFIIRNEKVDSSIPFIGTSFKKDRKAQGFAIFSIERSFHRRESKSH
jgi:hypothetical protein